MQQTSVDDLKRRVLLAIMAVAWLSSVAGWAVMESRGTASPVVRAIFGLNLLFHPVMGGVAWQRWQPLRVVERGCLLFAAALCGACMALRLYAPVWGAQIDLQPLYLWIPVIYVFVFTCAAHHRAALRLSLAILALFVAIGLPHLVRHADGPYGNFTLQLYGVSAVLIAALYFFAGHQHRLQLAQLTLDQLARLANTDELTQLANRRRISEAIEAERARLRRYGHVFSVILIDIDHFKAVNDRFGHAVGDQTLVALAARTAEALRDVDMLGRWGGEEFIVVLPETPFDESLHKAHALCRHIAEQPLLGQPITISCGVASIQPSDDAATLLRRADEALYAAKRQGRNRAEGAVA